MCLYYGLKHSSETTVEVNSMRLLDKMKKEVSSVAKMFTLVFSIERKGFLFVSIMCAVTSFMCPLMMGINYKIVKAIEVNFNGDFRSIVIMIAVLILTSAIFQVTKYSNLLLFEKMQIKVGTRLMNKVYLLVGDLKHSFFDYPDNTAKLQREVLFSQDSMLTQNIVHAISLICNVVSLILIFPVLYFAGIEVFFMILIVAIICNIFEFDEGYLRWEHQNIQGKKYNKIRKMGSYFYDKESIMEMRMLHSDNFIQKKWEQLNEAVFNEDYSFEKKINNRKFVYDIIRIVLNILPLFYISWKFGLGNVDIAIVFIVWQAQGQFNSTMASVFSEYKAVHYSVPYIDELCEFLEQRFETGCAAFSGSSSMVELKNVNFAYAEDNIILKNINVKILPGEKIAIIGSNGAGKTTLVKVLANLYEATSGNVFYGFDKSEAGAVWQDYVKFELSLAESIGLGDVCKINDRQVLSDVCGTVGIDMKAISLDDMIGRSFDPEGKIPSGGQWQKIAIARAVFGSKSFLFMDEPTAALDPISEVKLYSEIKHTFNDKTVVFVSHRVGFANLADRILFVNEGEIVEDGSHKELMKKKGYYYKFYNEQLKWYKEVETI